MNRSISTTRGNITIREATPSDAPRFRELRLEALLNNPIAFTADYQKNLNHPPKYWEEMLKMQAEESTIFVVEYENNLLGMTGIVRGTSPKTRHVGWIWGVYVHPGWRGLHIAEELIRTCFVWAIERHIDLAKLGVAAVNEPAIRCYERCGFKIYGIEPRAILYDGRYYDEHLMYVDLDG
jgi:ribosomal protein S18 acetylase RimI-like enzyme